MWLKLYSMWSVSLRAASAHTPSMSRYAAPMDPGMTTDQAARRLKLQWRLEMESWRNSTDMDQMCCR
eukprot:2340821-Karenia_brevis.AAC.1